VVLTDKGIDHIFSNVLTRTLPCMLESLFSSCGVSIRLDRFIPLWGTPCFSPLFPGFYLHPTGAGYEVDSTTVELSSSRGLISFFFCSVFLPSRVRNLISRGFSGFQTYPPIGLFFLTGRGFYALVTPFPGLLLVIAREMIHPFPLARDKGPNCFKGAFLHFFRP